MKSNFSLKALVFLGLCLSAFTDIQATEEVKKRRKGFCECSFDAIKNNKVSVILAAALATVCIAWSKERSKSKAEGLKTSYGTAEAFPGTKKVRLTVASSGPVALVRGMPLESTERFFAELSKSPTFDKSMELAGSAFLELFPPKQGWMGVGRWAYGEIQPHCTTSLEVALFMFDKIIKQSQSLLEQDGSDDCSLVKRVEYSFQALKSVVLLNMINQAITSKNSILANIAPENKTQYDALVARHKLLFKKVADNLGWELVE